MPSEWELHTASPTTYGSLSKIGEHLSRLALTLGETAYGLPDGYKTYLPSLAELEKAEQILTDLAKSARYDRAFISNEIKQMRINELNNK